MCEENSNTKKRYEHLMWLLFIVIDNALNHSRNILVDNEVFYMWKKLEKVKKKLRNMVEIESL
jgi:hypothetical protein